MEDTPGGRVPAGPGWFVVNVAEARGVTMPGHGAYVPFESRDRAPFAHFGVNIHVLAPGDTSALYHREPMQEGFLVLAGECVVLIEEEEHLLRAWDYFHCPPGTAHALVGAGDGPCAVLMIGARGAGDEATYPRSELAARHGASVPAEMAAGAEPYEAADWGEGRTEAPLPWPPTRA